MFKLDVEKVAADQQEKLDKWEAGKQDYITALTENGCSLSDAELHYQADRPRNVAEEVVHHVLTWADWTARMRHHMPHRVAHFIFQSGIRLGDRGSYLQDAEMYLKHAVYLTKLKGLVDTMSTEEWKAFDEGVDAQIKEPLTTRSSAP